MEVKGILLLLSLLFIFISLILMIFALFLSIYNSTSKKYKERKKQELLENYDIEDIRERLDDIAEIKKSNREILEKLNYLISEMNKGNIK